MSGRPLRFVDAAVLGGGRELCVRDGVIAPSADDGEVVDCRGRLLAPALFDVGVAAVDRPAFRTGGVVRVAPLPDQNPVLDEPGAVQRLALIGKPDLWIHPVAAATRGLAGAELAEFAFCASAGARAIGTGRGWIADSGVMRRVLQYARDLDLPVIAHAEDGGLVAGAVATDGVTATRLGLASAPALVEALAVARDLLLAEETGARLHFHTLTTARAFELVRAAKARGVAVTCGTTPAYLLLSDIHVADFRTFARLSPPLRSEADRQATRAALADGTIDVLCSGHDPRGPEEKRLPFADAAPGAAGAQTLLALGLGLVRDGLIGIERLFELVAANPARLLGVHSGQLAQGFPADLVLVDADGPWQVVAERLPGLAGNTPFDGLPVQGRVLRTWKGGRELA